MNSRPLSKSITFKKSGGRGSVSAVISAPSIRPKGRGGSPSGPKIQLQRAVKQKSTIQNPRESRGERREARGERREARGERREARGEAAKPRSSFCLLRFATVGSQPTHSTFPQPMRYRAGVPTSSFFLLPSYFFLLPSYFASPLLQPLRQPSVQDSLK